MWRRFRELVRKAVLKGIYRTFYRCPEYTKEFHLKRLRKMMQRTDVCKCCPVQIGFTSGVHFVCSGDSDPCRVCVETVGMEVAGARVVTLWPSRLKCPCRVLGPEEALKRTREVLDL